MIPAEASQITPLEPAAPEDISFSADAKKIIPDGHSDVGRILGAMKRVESGGNYSVTAKDLGHGAYQFMPDTWKDWSTAYARKSGLGTGPLDIHDPKMQDAVARDKVQEYLSQGYSPKQIASLWNSSHPDWEGRRGINKYGVAYDVPRHVAKFEAAYNGQPFPKSSSSLEPIRQKRGAPAQSEHTFFDLMTSVFSPDEVEAADIPQDPNLSDPRIIMTPGETVIHLDISADDKPGMGKGGSTLEGFSPVSEEDIVPFKEQPYKLKGAGEKFRSGKEPDKAVDGLTPASEDDIEYHPGVSPSPGVRATPPEGEGKEQPQRKILPYGFEYRTSFGETKQREAEEKKAKLVRGVQLAKEDPYSKEMSEWLDDNVQYDDVLPIFGVTGKLAKFLKPKIANQMPWQKAIEKIKSRWIGNKDYKIFRNSVEAQKLQDQIMKFAGEKHYGPKSKAIDKAVQIYLDIKRDPSHITQYWPHITEEQRQVVRDAIELSKDPEFLKIAKQIRQSYDEIGIQALDTGVIRNVLDNYAARVWKPRKEGETAAGELYRKFGTTTGHAKERVFDTIVEGQAFGRELQVEGATNNLNILKDEIAKVIEDKEVLKRMGKAKWIDGKPLLKDHPEDGYKLVNHPNFKAYRYFGSIEVESIVKHAQELSETVRSTSTSTVTGGAGATSGPIARLEEIVKESLKLRGMSEGEASNYIGKLKGSANSDAIQTVIENLKERLVVIKDKATVEGHEFKPIVRKDLVVTGDGTILRKSELFAPSEVADSLNKITGTSALKNQPGATGKVLDAVTKFNAQAKSIILTTSLFHHQAFLRSYLLGTHGITGSLNPFKAYQAGLKSIADNHPILEHLMKDGGLTLGRQIEWEEKVWTEEAGRIAKTIDKIPGAAKARQAFINLMERQTKFLFGRFGAGLKAQSAILEYQYSLKQFPYWTPEFRAKTISEYVNNNFGGLNLARLERNPTGQHMFRLGALASDWTESNFRQFVKAFGTGEESKMYQRFWAGVFLRGQTATVAANLLVAQFDDQSFFERYKAAWDTGKLRWLDLDITPLARKMGGLSDKRYYFGVMGHMTDALNWMAHPVATIDHKSSPAVNPIIEALAGVDWKGDPFTTFDQLIGRSAKGDLKGKLTAPVKATGPIGYSQIPSFALDQALSKLPIPFQNILGWTTGQTDAFLAITKSVGLRTSSAPVLEDWERGIRAIKSETPHYTGSTDKSKEKRKLKKDIEAGIRAGDGSARAKLKEAEAQGLIRPDERKKIEREAKMSDLQVQVKGLTADQAVRTYLEVLKPEERDHVRHIVHSKIRATKTLKPEEKKQYYNLIRNPNAPIDND